MKSRLVRGILSAAVLGLTAGAFIWYFTTHPNVRHQLGEVSPWLLGGLLALYLGTVVALALVFIATLRLCKLNLKAGESTLLTAYSSVINFFGPLQSGPAFRAIYLKKRYNLNLKSYAAATVVYYGFFGAFSGLLLLSGILGWWLLPLGVLGLLAAFLAAHSPRLTARLPVLDLRGWYYLAAATALQVTLLCLIYFAELHSINPQISLSQALVYAGAANLALFVSLTPGAIGFRESFLLFSQQLHHISPENIVTANIIDRAMYITLMLLLGVFIVASHAKQELDKTVKA